jgi:hypothetical protein
MSLNEYQKEAFRMEALCLEEEKRENGYTSMDLVAIGFYLIKNNIDKAEKLEGILANINSLIEMADKLINGE